MPTKLTHKTYFKIIFELFKTIRKSTPHHSPPLHLHNYPTNLSDFQSLYQYQTSCSPYMILQIETIPIHSSFLLLIFWNIRQIQYFFQFSKVWDSYCPISPISVACIHIASANLQIRKNSENVFLQIQLKTTYVYHAYKNKFTKLRQLECTQK
jgi:hypothetical protein